MSTAVDGGEQTLSTWPGWTILLAACSYRWLEAPMLRLKQRYAHVASHPV